MRRNSERPEVLMMRKYAIAALLVLLTSPAVPGGQSQTPARKPAHILAEMEPVLTRIAVFEHGRVRDDLMQFMEFVQESMASPAQLRQIETRLLRFLQSNATEAGKDFVLEELSLLASDASIPVLVPMMERAGTAERARFVLERIPGAGADEALRKSLETSTGSVRIGIINSLGRRRVAASVPALATLTTGDAGTATAALAALATIANRPAAEALATARRRTDGTRREQASEAYAACADQMTKRGEKAAASKIYRELIVAREPVSVRIRALAGLAATDGKDAIPELAAAIESQDAKEQAAAIAFLKGIPGADAANTLGAEFPKIGAAGQVRVLAALMDRGEDSARPLVTSALRNSAIEVRTAGLAALGQLGNESSVAVLAEAAAREGAERDAARQSLYGLRGPKIDATIVALIVSANGKVKSELIMAAGERGAASAASALAGALTDREADVRREALRALKNVGGADQAPAVMGIVLNATAASERKEATQSLTAMLKRSGPELMGTVLMAYQNTQALEARLGLLEVMGQSANEKALPVLRSGLKDSNSEIARAAILALSNWDGPAPMADLLAIAKNGGDSPLGILALRGYLKLVSLPSDRPASESARMLGEAMPLARQAAEKRSLLSLLPAYPCAESLQLAQTLVNDEEVAREAKAAVARINVARKLQ
jgi:HEAT repeat protein